MIPDIWRIGEIAVIGLGKSGTAVSTLLAREGARVYASDAGSSTTVDSSAALLRPLGIDVDAGRHDLDRIAHATLVVASPGIPPNAPPLERARAAGLPVIGEIEVALHAIPGLRYIAITGTNGKSTVTAMAAHLLRGLGLDGVAAGNIGMPLAEVALRDRRPDWVALEVSSFQLHDTPSINPAVGVVTNLSADHLDRYTSVDEYFADKAMLFRNAHDRSKWVLNGDDDLVLHLAERRPVTPPRGARRVAEADAADSSDAASDAPRTPLRGDTYLVSLASRDAGAWYDRAHDRLVVLGKPLLARSQLQLIGEHNVANALFASLAVMVADPAHESSDARARLAEALRSFRGLPHRLELAGEYEGVRWINDSKATNVSSTLVALRGMTQPTVLLLGGRHKGEPYTALADELRRTVKAVIAYGEAAPMIVADVGDVVPTERMGRSFEDIIERARELAEPGDAVLLSPACSSYDMFKNYEERGTMFKRLAGALEDEKS
ncbi:MAG TPA: UDP-N-acetylmuramoyl-L-alanine--D-glutamate ligase [Gemmatimonadaceae bacterium]|nr:UDP-N-acetylmuramoyl-L-alanine--D-glutamate ligase [Gemmatimonadaceae bacterium]